VRRGPAARRRAGWRGRWRLDGAHGCRGDMASMKAEKGSESLLRLRSRSCMRARQWGVQQSLHHARQLRRYRLQLVGHEMLRQSVWRMKKNRSLTGGLSFCFS
jgi:hypothetical protein